MRLLLIDDNLNDVKSIFETLSEEENVEFDIDCKNALGEALEHLSKNKVDLVLLSLGLRDGSKLAGFERLQRAVPDTPLVVLTCALDDPLGSAAMRKGAQDCLYKAHLDRRMLVHSIRHAIERHAIKRKLDEVTDELRTANARLARLAIIDPLTGLLNRRGLEQALSSEIQFSRRGASLAAILVDLDDFKIVNDTYGYTTGDVVLQDVARKLSACLRATDSAARIGGDEFMILLTQSRPVDAERVAQKLRLAISETPMLLQTGVISITASLSVVRVPEEIVSVDELLAQAHLGLRESKKAGKNRVSGLYKAVEMDPKPDIHAMLNRGDQFTAVKQPIVRLDTEKTIGYELFTRWSLEPFQMPDDFFRFAREANSLTRVDHLCFRASAAASATIDPELRCHINIYPSTLNGVSARQLLEELPKHRPPSSYCIELSEHQIIGDPQMLAEPMGVLKQAGVQLVIEDVGFGRSNLESLIVLEPQLIKIDPQCVHGLASDAALARSLSRLLQIAATLGAETMAEAVEDRQDCNFLKELGVKYGQGFLFGKPA